MIISRLLSNQIVNNWELIKFAVLAVNNISSNYAQEYCNGLLINLLAEKYQCWFGVTDNRLDVKGVAITKIYKDVGNISHLMIDSLYVYSTTIVEERTLFIENIKKFGNTINCKDILFHTSNSKLVEVANLLGFEETSKIFKINIGGV